MVRVRKQRPDEGPRIREHAREPQLPLTHSSEGGLSVVQGYGNRAEWFASKQPGQVCRVEADYGIAFRGWLPPHLSVVTAGVGQAVVSSLRVVRAVGDVRSSDGVLMPTIVVPPGMTLAIALIFPSVTAWRMAELLRAQAPLWFDQLIAPATPLWHTSHELARGTQPITDSISHRLIGAMQEQGTLSFDCIERATGKAPQHKLDVFNRLRRVRTLFDGDFRGNLELHQMAEVARFTPTHFQRTYARVFGESAFTHMDRRRLGIAERMLMEGYRTTVVALQVGFDSRASFSRWFKERTGATPRTSQRATSGASAPVPASALAHADRPRVTDVA